MTTTLERLEKKRGSVFTTYDYGLVRKKASGTPETLTDEDLEVLRFFGGERCAAEATAARAQALTTTAANATRGPYLNGAAAPAQSVAFPSALWDVDASDPAAELQRWSVANAIKAVPVAIWHAAVAVGRQKREAVEGRVESLEAKNAELEQRLSAVEARPPSLPYRGTYQAETAYHENELVTYAGSLWVCRALTYSRPGSDRSWTLAVKNGKGAR